MSDRLRQALETEASDFFGAHPEQKEQAIRTILAAARSVLEGEPVWWCEEHRITAGSNPKPSGCVVGWNILTASEGAADPMCRMVERVLVEGP